MDHSHQLLQNLYLVQSSSYPKQNYTIANEGHCSVALYIGCLKSCHWTANQSNFHRQHFTTSWTFLNSKIYFLSRCHKNQTHNYLRRLHNLPLCIESIEREYLTRHQACNNIQCSFFFPLKFALLKKTFDDLSSLSCTVRSSLVWYACKSQVPCKNYSS